MKRSAAARYHDPMPKRTKQPKKPKRPKDVNQLAHELVRLSTEEPEPVSKSDISRVMAELGRRGGRKGGKMRLETLSEDRRREIAVKAARARWKKHQQENAKQPSASPSPSPR